MAFDTPTGKQTTYEAFMKQSIRPSWAEKLIRKQNIWRPKQFIQRKEFRFSTHAQLQLPDAEVVNEDPVAFLKSTNDRRKRYLGCGGRLIKPLLEHQMIDEWYIQITPVLLGDGIPLFQRNI